jgi:hypothetical protein
MHTGQKIIPYYPTLSCEVSRTLLSESSVPVDNLLDNGGVSLLRSDLSGVGGIISSSEPSSRSTVDPEEIISSADSPVLEPEECIHGLNNSFY